MAAPGRGYGQGEAPPVAVEERQCPEIDAAIVHAMLYHLADRIHPSAAMTVHHTLRKAGSPAGVIDRNARVLVESRPVNRHGISGRRGEERLVIGHDVLYRRGI